MFLAFNSVSRCVDVQETRQMLIDLVPVHAEMLEFILVKLAHVRTLGDFQVVADELLDYFKTQAQSLVKDIGRQQAQQKQ
jgi:hypothetical protein